MRSAQALLTVREASSCGVRPPVPAFGAAVVVSYGFEAHAVIVNAAATAVNARFVFGCP